MTLKIGGTLHLHGAAFFVQHPVRLSSWKCGNAIVM